MPHRDIFSDKLPVRQSAGLSITSTFLSRPLHANIPIVPGLIAAHEIGTIGNGVTMEQRDTTSPTNLEASMHRNDSRKIPSSSRFQDGKVENMGEEKSNREVWLESIIKTQAAELERLKATLAESDNRMADLKRENEQFKSLRINHQQEAMELRGQLQIREEEKSSSDRRARETSRELEDLKAKSVERDIALAALKLENGRFKSLRASHSHEIANLQSKLRVQEEEIQNFRLRESGQLLEDLKATLLKREELIIDLKRENERLTDVLDLRNRLQVREEGHQKHQSADRGLDSNAYMEAWIKSEQAKKALWEDIRNLQPQLQYKHTEMLKCQTKTDRTVVAYFIQIVERLNKHILGWAACFVDELARAERVTKVDAGESERALNKVGESLGSHFVSLLLALHDANDPAMALQITIRAILIWFSFATIRGWSEDRITGDQSVFLTHSMS
jgi:chromosome segregation ATPase